MERDKRWSLRRRGAIALAAAVIAGTLTLLIRVHGVTENSDFDQIWLAARALRAGNDPYAAVARQWLWPLYYPLPAVLIALPFSSLRVEIANALFMALSIGAFAYAVSERPVWLLALASRPVIYAIERGQWSPALVAAVFLPWLGFLFAVKPTIGAALFLYKPTWRAFVLACILTLASLAIRPSWPAAWMSALRQAPHVRAPITYLFGPIVSLGLLRWRRREARLFLLLGCMPQTFTAYETVPLFLIPKTAREMLTLIITSLIATYIITAIQPPQPQPLAMSAALGAPFLIAGMYLPALAMILRRPNEGPLPARLERMVARAPRWLRGQSATQDA